MTGEEIDCEVRRIVAEVYGIDPNTLTSETDFYTDLDDSMQVVEVMLACEEVFDIDAPDVEVAGLRTVGELVELVKAHVKRKG